jgi:hypothetical protein
VERRQGMRIIEEKRRGEDMSKEEKGGVYA